MGDYSANNLSGKVGLDTTDFKGKVTEINREIRLVESGFRASAAALGDWGKDASGLEMRMQALNQEIALQQQKVEALKGVYGQVAAEQGESSRASQDLQIKINKETETLNKMNVELKETATMLDKVVVESSQTGKDLEKMGSGAKGISAAFGEMKSKMGDLKNGLAGVAVAAVGVKTAISGLKSIFNQLVVSTARSADELVKLSQQTGLTTDQLQELKYAGEQLGFDLGTVSGAYKKLTKNIFEASTGSKSMQEAFGKLGVSIYDSSGNLRDSEDVFNDVMTALGGISDETLRDGLAMEIFGKSASELNPIIEAGTDEMSRLRLEAHDLGAVLKGESVESAAELSDSLDRMKASLGGVTARLGAEVIPAITGLLDAIAKLPPGVLEGFVAFAVIVTVIIHLVTLFGSLATAVTAITALFGSGGALAGAGTAIVGVLGAISLPVVALVGAFVLLGVVIAKFGEDALRSLVMLFAIVGVYLVQIWDAVKQFGVNVGEAMRQAWNNLVAVVQSIGPSIVAAASGIVQAIVGVFSYDWGSIGNQIVYGVWNGIQNLAVWFKAQISGFFSSIIATVKGELGIDSPSKVFAGIGKNMALGLGQGFVQQMAGIERQIAAAVAATGSGFTPVLSGVGGQSVQNAENYTFYAPIYVQSNGGNLGSALKVKRY